MKERCVLMVIAFLLVCGLLAKAQTVNCQAVGQFDYCYGPSGSMTTIQHSGSFDYYYGNLLSGYSQQVGANTYYYLQPVTPPPVPAYPVYPVYPSAAQQANQQMFSAGYAVGQNWGRNFSAWLAQRRAKKPPKNPQRRDEEIAKSYCKYHPGERAYLTYQCPKQPLDIQPLPQD